MKKGLCAFMFAVFVLSGIVFADDDPVGKKCMVNDHGITERKYAMVVEKEKGKNTMYFDDIGCAVEWRATKCMPTQVTCDAVSYVFDYFTGERIHVRAAYYVHDTSLNTPQGYGIVALRDRESAERLLRELKANGKVLDFEEVQALVEEMEH